MPMDFVTQNALLIVLVVTSGLGLLWPAMLRPAGNAVNPAQATMLINREDALVLDVREAGEFIEGHLPDARNIPTAKLSERIGELEKFKDKAIVVCCASGMRSNKACAELKKQGFTKISNLAGGVDAWVGAGYPVKKGKAAK
jgi:rhodanese-related sulfurtransferase